MEIDNDLIDLVPFSTEFLSDEHLIPDINMDFDEFFEESSIDTKIPSEIMSGVRAIVWFRRDLRMHDNLALLHALDIFQRNKEEKVQLLPLYIIQRPKRLLCGVNRFQFLLESIGALAESIAARGSRLLIARGESVEVFKRILPAWKPTCLIFDQVTEPFAIARDQRVRDLAMSLGISVELTNGYTMYDLDKVIEKNDGAPPKTYTSFLRIISSFPTPPQAKVAPDEMPTFEDTPSQLYARVINYWQTHRWEELYDTETVLDEDLCDTPWEDIIAGSQKTFSLPKLTDFGFKVPARHSFMYGGEEHALSILHEYCQNEKRVVKFEKPKTSPAETSPSKSTTSLSPYVYFGCISPRTFYHRVREIQDRHAKGASAPPVSLDGQLLWREFFHCNGHANPYFDKIEENPICLYIDWRYHRVPETAEEEEALSEDEKLAKAQFEAWKEGQTGYPWIDAIMIQLREEGWMHHLARHSAACFLTRGDLYVSWVRGLEVFQERLIDHDWCVNSGNWLWLSASAFFSAYFRVYSPSTFGKKWDPEGKFIRKYIPALANMPVKYIYEPWKAPMTVQRSANCLVGKDYPFPIVDHKIAMRRCMAGMKAMYSAHRFGEPPPIKGKNYTWLHRIKRRRHEQSTQEEEE